MSPEQRVQETPGAADKRRRATQTGIVISRKMDKTIVVAVERRVSHPRYDRVVKRTSKFYAHDEKNACKEGDVVTIVESRPLSRLKRWRLREIVRSDSRLAGPSSGAETAEGEEIARPAHRKRRELSGAESPAEAEAPGEARAAGAGESKDEE